MISKSFLASLVGVAVFITGCSFTEVKPSTSDKVPEKTETNIVSNDNVVVKTAKAASYEDYTPSRLAELKSSNSPYVIFFHANWCPICLRMEKNLLGGDLEKLPEETIILKADFDDEKDLKREYGVRLQSTLVIVDGDGEVVAKVQDPVFEDLKSLVEKSLE